MKGSTKKNLSEFAINLFSARWLMTSAAQLLSGNSFSDPLQQEVANNCHIYLICKTPSLGFAKETIAYSNGSITGDIYYKINGEERKIPFEQPFPLMDGATRIEVTDYPHREIRTVNNEGTELRYVPANALTYANELHVDLPELRNFEVLYVGQAYGDGNRSAFDRLKSHSTLQKILATAQYESPDSEISILAFEYAPYRVVTKMDGRAGDLVSDEDDEFRFYSILDNPLSEHQQICLAEAGLIRYFQPKYNEIYKESFPSQSHKILSACYDLDFSGLVVEIDTEELCFSLYSESVRATDHHICKIDLVSHQDRWGFFHLFADGKAERLPGVITGS